MILWTALAILALFVLLPVAGALWGLASLSVTLAVLLPFAELVGESQFRLGGAVQFGAALLVLPLAIDGACHLVRLARRATGTFRAPIPWYRGSLPWVLGALAAVDLILVPLRSIWNPELLRTALAAALLAGAVDAVFLLLLGCLWLASAALGGLWRLGRRSAMLTGFLAATALLAATAGLVNLAILDVVGSAILRPLNARTQQVCSQPGSAALCGLERAHPSSSPAAIERLGLARCMEDLHGGGSQGSDLCSEMIQQLRPRLGQSDAEDVVHETLLAVCLRHERQPVRDLRSYFVRSVQNRANSARRRRLCELDPEAVYCPWPDPEEQALHDERIRAASHAYCAMSLQDAMIIELRDFQGEDYAELARRFGTTEAAVRQRHSRALRSFTAEYYRRCI
ncbi:MAG: sigma-70 family RNA polymerase sigma factor [Deltaproteobacteria bacterium]|nr:sigma-70 family RNA polymerase sigma factor [Deltaproteobacteria bacterium]